MLEILLKDRTTGGNIIWANAEHGRQEITADDVKLIRPRWQKLREQQRQRTKDRAEIFTPPEVCKLQNELIDADEHDWQAYVGARFLEITCGEAPYLVNRYNAVTGEPIPIKERVGLLDRKLRVVDKETSAPKDWIDYAVRAVQSVYGYEFLGDNLYLARRNVFETFKDYYRQRFTREPPEDILREVAEVISWNLFQMDGLKCSPPFTEEVNLFGGVYCRIKDWFTGKTFEFIELTRGGRR